MTRRQYRSRRCTPAKDSSSRSSTCRSAGSGQDLQPGEAAVARSDGRRVLDIGGKAAPAMRAPDRLMRRKAGEELRLLYVALTRAQVPDSCCGGPRIHHPVAAAPHDLRPRPGQRGGSRAKALADGQPSAQTRLAEGASACTAEPVGRVRRSPRFRSSSGQPERDRCGSRQHGSTGPRHSDGVARRIGIDRRAPTTLPESAARSGIPRRRTNRTNRRTCARRHRGQCRRR